MKWKLTVPEDYHAAYVELSKKIYDYQGERKEIINDYEKHKKCSTEDGKEILELGFITTAWDLFLNFVIGEEKCSYYLAESFLKGIGVTQSTSLASLTFFIGAKLGDKKSKDYISTNLQNENVSDELVDKCAKKIKEYKNAINNKTWGEMIAIAKSFNEFTIQNQGPSYYEAMKKPVAGEIWNLWDNIVTKEPVVYYFNEEGDHQRVIIGESEDELF